MGGILQYLHLLFEAQAGFQVLEKFVFLQVSEVFLKVIAIYTSLFSIIIIVELVEQVAEQFVVVHLCLDELNILLGCGSGQDAGFFVFMDERYLVVDIFAIVL